MCLVRSASPANGSLYKPQLNANSYKMAEKIKNRVNVSVNCNLN